MSRAGAASFPETSPAGSISPPHNESGAATRRMGWGRMGEASARCGLNPPRLVRTYNNTVNFGSGLTGRFLIPAAPSPITARDLIDSVSTSTRPFSLPPVAVPFSSLLATLRPVGAAVAMLHLQDRLPVLRASLNRQQFEALNNSWRSNLTTNKLDRIIRDLVRAFKPPSAASSVTPLHQR